jgi:hypothetical protein
MDALWVVLVAAALAAGGYGVWRLHEWGKDDGQTEVQLSEADSKRLARRSAASPLHVTFRAGDDRLIDFQVRPARFTAADLEKGPEVPEHVLDDLRRYVDGLSGRQRRKDLKLVYRDGHWMQREAGSSRAAEGDGGGGEPMPA